MNKRIMSFFLTVMLVIATVCQPVAATTLTAEEEQAIQAKKAAKAESMEASAENVKREMSTEMQDAAITISENGYDLVEVNSETPYVVFKFVPQETKEYCFFSNRESGDPCVDLYIGDEYYDEYDDAGGRDFEASMVMTAGKEYYFKLRHYDEGVAATYYFTITSDYESRTDWLYRDKTVSSVSINDLPQHEFLDLESDAIDAYISPDGLQVVTYFTDGTAYTQYIYSPSDYEYDDDDRVVATYFESIKNTYKMYWETLKEVGDALYMDETVPNSLCIEDENGQVTKYPVVIKETDIGSVAVKTAPAVTAEKILIPCNPYYYQEIPFSMAGLVLTVTRENGTTYDLTYEYYCDEEEDEEYYMFTSSEDVEILPYSFEMERDENGNFLLGDNTLTITYGGKTTTIPTQLYTVTSRTALTPIAVKNERYPFNQYDTSGSLKGLKLQTIYSDGTSSVVEVAEDTESIELDGNSAYVYGDADGGKAYLYCYADNKDWEIGTYEKVIKPMSAYPGLKNINPDVPVDVTIDTNANKVIYRYTPDVTAEYRIYSAPVSEEDSDPMVSMYTETECVTSEDDTIDLQFDLTQELKAGTTYYFLFDTCRDKDAYRVTLESTKQLSQVITAPASITKKMNDAPFAIGAKALGNAPMTYTSSNPAVATIDAKGMVTVKSAGTTTITINAAQTKSFTAATKKVTLTVNKIPVPIHVADTITKAKGSKKFSLNASCVGKMTYSSSNKKVATVDKNGKITVKNCGKAVITIKATANGYLNGEKKVVIKVVPKKAKIKSVKSSKAGQITVKWNRQKEAKGYIIEYSTDKNFKSNVKSVKVKKNKTTSKTIKKLKKGKKYYVRVKAYVTIDKKAETGAASAKKKVTIKK